ncbi:MAG: N-6 DNA methylase [Candidatus Caldarchaeum sp.]
MSGAGYVDLDDVLSSIRQAVNIAQTEEDLRLRVSGVIEQKVLKPLGITQVGKYEYTLVSGVKVDALYGHVLIEYKAPGKLSSKADVSKAKEQLVNYIVQEAGVEDRFRYFLGIILGDRIAFLRYDPRASGDRWVLRGPYEINRETVIKLVEALRGLQRKRLDVDSLVRDFGPQSDAARKLVKLLYERLKASKSGRVRALFDDWLRLFSQTTGYSQAKLKELKEIVEDYGLPKQVDYNALLFSLHTYYGLVMKLLAAEIAYLYGGGKWLRSYVGELENAYMSGGVDGLREVLRELEEGGVFSRLLNIVNFVEGDYFSWYLDVLDRDLGDAVAEVARRLGDYEPATPHLEPETTRDLLKRLYQSLIPRDVRHKLGEFYTPDWLAELLLNEMGLTVDRFEEMGSENPLMPLELRVLDPACGSGTFLILYLKRLREYAENHYLTDQLVSYVLANVVGYDLNPLAVLAARTNYLLSIGDLLGYARGPVELPVYLADSLLIESAADLYGQVYVLRTSVGVFKIPRSVVDRGLLTDVLSVLKTSVANRYTVKEFKGLLAGRFNLADEDLQILGELFDVFLKLEVEGKNHVWVSIVRNAFAPILKGRFDYVVGNPPWINWENLPESYREASKKLWMDYGLVKIRGGMGLGKVKRDMAMLFFVRCFDLYLREGGVHGFLVPFTLFKTQAGAGFRTKIANTCRIVVVHDLVTLYPFEGAVNRTAALVAEKPMSESAVSRLYEFRHVVWVNRRRGPMPTDASLDEVLRLTERYEMLIVPLKANDPGSSWMQTTPKALNAIRKVLGKSEYRAYAGVYPGFNQIYFVKVLDKDKDGNLIITNPPESGQKKSVKQITAKIEPDLVYPLIRGRDVKKWRVEFNDRYVVVPHNPKTGGPISEKELKMKQPLTYDFLRHYQKELENRSIHRLWGRGNPFYSVYDIGAYTFKPYKVVWKEVSARMKAGGFHAAVVEPVDDAYLGRITPIPEHTVVLIPTKNVDEAHYLAGIINSTILAYYGAYITVRDIENILIPQFNPHNEIHKKISMLARKLHELVKNSQGETSFSELEDELDITVAEMYGISEDELAEIRKLYNILAGEEVMEDVEEELEKPEEPTITFTKTTLTPNTEDIITLTVINPHTEKLQLTLHLPNQQQIIKEIEQGEHFIEIPLKPLPQGIYNIEYQLTLNGKTIKKETIQLTVAQPRRFRA